MREKILKKLKEFIQKYELIYPKSRIGVAISGGPDSVFLLTMLLQLKRDLNLDLSLLHFNHRLRKEAIQEENFVKSIAEKNSLQFFSESCDVSKFKTENKLSLEEAARTKRYGFFKRIRNTHGLDFIALGHTKDDVVETLLINLIRGSSIDGLSSLQPKRDFYIRPIMTFSKKEILTFLNSKNIEYKIDMSNRDLNFTRNKIRHELLPFLERFNPNIKDTLFRECLLFWEDSLSLKAIAKANYISSTNIKDSKLEIDLTKLSPLDSIRKRVISLSIKKLLNRQYSISFHNLERINQAIKTGKTVSLRKLLRAYKTGNKLIIIKL